ncbi:predicted protein [Postia placenta Mad-698-R]|uniref:Uncharacterized protein n=1 Tax=Postia placenta MAD-698-R-SB12 TaxID=670580 RepID=A0A1X6NEI5_9APHY|nr:hypothetical protein POSPLADRAFT_1050953 [Postia placenta MAD-698-R-SB12]EED80327.1 predicted protein [Postia placenta Mad-698-R]OSX66783.1 hypothetical protein POSPLADRAFT_1050953 [Postia placenta MAD-698-R-SB12]
MSTPEALIQHPPAMRVGGRRLSTTTRPKPQSSTETKSPSPPAEAPNYPRPAPPGEQPPPHDPQEDEVPKKERKKGGGGDEHERRLQESLYRKAEQNRPSRDGHTAKNVNAVGGGGRIGQPAGRTLM